MYVGITRKEGYFFSNSTGGAMCARKHQHHLCGRGVLPHPANVDVRNVLHDVELLLCVPLVGNLPHIRGRLFFSLSLNFSLSRFLSLAFSLSRIFCMGNLLATACCVLAAAVACEGRKSRRCRDGVRHGKRTACWLERVKFKVCVVIGQLWEVDRLSAVCYVCVISS